MHRFDEKAMSDCQGDRWDIVQFHPSYGYEDFVRGIRVKTENGATTYETVNRLFGEMAERARQNPDESYYLILDEINRANVAAVLGELIYGLEYRGEKISTQYAIEGGDSSLVVPGNLFIIGTMNTADRTIGHIDYAVRRRFAFLSLLPDRGVVATVSRALSAVQFFDKVRAIFEGGEACVSDDFIAADVAVGHSYFLAKNDAELRDKIRFQVVPILEEYLRDGVMTDGARAKIDGIRSEAETLIDVELVNRSARSLPEFDRKYQNARWRQSASEQSLALMRIIADHIAVRDLRRWVLHPTLRSDYLGWKKPSGGRSNAFRFQPGKDVLRVVVDADKVKQFTDQLTASGWQPLKRHYSISLPLRKPSDATLDSLSLAFGAVVDADRKRRRARALRTSSRAPGEWSRLGG